MRLLRSTGRATSTLRSRSPPSSAIAASAIVERLAVLAGLVLDRLDALALLGLGDDRDRLADGVLGLGVGGLDRLDVVAVDRDRLPAERLDAADVAVEVPAEHRLARLAEAVDVDDRGDVVELLPAGVLEGLPHRALGHLGVAAQHPHAVGQLVQRAAGHRHADADRQALAERAGGDVGRRDARRRVTLAGASRACGTSAARRRRSRPRPSAPRSTAARRGPWRRSGGRCPGSSGRCSPAAGGRRSGRPSGRRRTSRRWGGPSRRRPTSGPSPPAAAARARAGSLRRGP